MNKIYILEGSDGVGKSVLANEIAKQRKASVVHSYFDLSWDIKQHHLDMLRAARIISKWKPVVLDRWAHSELIYGEIFRGKPGYNILKLVDDLKEELRNAIWIYCRNDRAVENHLKLAKERHEMFDDMTQIVERFDKFIKSDYHDWIEYDYDKVNMQDFVRRLP